MSNFLDPAINKAKGVLASAADKAKDQAKRELANQIDSVKNIAAQAASKALAKVQSKIRDGVSGITSSFGGSSSAAASVGSVIVGEIAAASQTSLFAKPAFTGTGLDAVAVQDVYAIKGDDKVINKAAIFDKATASLVNQALKGVGDLKKDLSSLVSNKDGSFSLSPEGLKDRLKDVLSGSNAAVDRLGDSITKTATGAVQGATQALMDRFSGTIDSAVSNFSTKNISDARGLFNSINELTRNPDMAKLMDLGAETRLLTGVFKEAIDLRVPKAIEVLIDGDTVAIKQALKNITSNAMESGDMVTAKLLADKLGSNQILALEPRAVEKLLSGFTLPQGTKQNELSDLGVTLKSTLVSINQKWNITSRAGGNIFNLEAMTSMSEDAKRVLETDPTLIDQIYIAGFYSRQSYNESIDEKYPLCRTGFR